MQNNVGENPGYGSYKKINEKFTSSFSAFCIFHELKKLASEELLLE